MESCRLPVEWKSRLKIPVIAAPMLRISGPELAAAACSAGVIGSFPTANARSSSELNEWVAQIKSEISDGAAPFAANLIMRSPRFEDDLSVLVRHRVELVITSVGSPSIAIDPLHAVGSLVFADVATVRHARQAIEAGADGLVLLTAGAGGQTGWLNPFAFVRAVRAFYHGPLVLSGGLSDGVSLAAAKTLGCDLGYMGTAFLATEESRAEPDYKQMAVDSNMDDIFLTRAFTGLPTSMLVPSILAAGLDPRCLDETVTPARASEMFGSGGDGPARWSQVWSAGHSVSGVNVVASVSGLVKRLAEEYYTQSTR
jgi:nitronate monooxygenase